MRAKLQNGAEDMIDMMRGRIAKITISVNSMKIHQIHDVMHSSTAAQHSTLHKSRQLCIQHVFLASRNTVHALANRAQGIRAMAKILFPFRIFSMNVIV